MGKPEDKQGPAAVEKCHCQGCKSKPARLGFCMEHFDQYKFGLINKAGQQVPDYQKKLGHYEAFRKGKVARAA